MYGRPSWSMGHEGQEERNDGCHTAGCPLAVTPAIRCQLGGSSGATQTPSAKRQEPAYAMETNLQRRSGLANTVSHEHIDTNSRSRENDKGLGKSDVLGYAQYLRVAGMTT